MSRVDLLRDELLRFELEQPAEDDGLEAFRKLSQPLPPAAAPATRVQGFCVICKQRDAVRSCLNCERAVCQEDVWRMLGICKDCATEEEVRQGREATKRPDLGIKWVED